MSFDEIARLGRIDPMAIPLDGLRVLNRQGGRPAAPSRYICIELGPGLAKRLALASGCANVSLHFGSDEDAGKIAISVDGFNGAFEARRFGNGFYRITVNAASADGFFSTRFPTFTVSPVKVLDRPNRPPLAVFPASEAMLAVED